MWCGGGSWGLGGRGWEWRLRGGGFLRLPSAYAELTPKQPCLCAEQDDRAC